MYAFLPSEYYMRRTALITQHLQKTPKLRTIVNKLDTIHSTYRYFDMEVLAGEQNFITTLNEADCTFTFDFSRVYWNSRLQGEHERLVALLPPKSVVADVMAGVGPFAIPAAKKGCYVLGNDLNPESVKWMRENRVQNRVSFVGFEGLVGRADVEVGRRDFTSYRD
jgi:tRNA (guanine37-N1)-methyltransferase